MRKLGWLLIGIALLTQVRAQPGPFPSAHAHNDYVHREPLRQALRCGFLSVEADVHLTADGRLLVGHDAVDGHSPDLESLYLKPLDSLLRRNSGHVHAHSMSTFTLMIDLKTEGKPTIEALLRLLQQRFPDFLSATGGIQVMMSGNVPKSELLLTPFCGLRIDGRPSDLGLGIPSDRMPWISDRFSRWGRVENGKVDEESLQTIAKLAQQVHQEHKRLRLWAIPDTAENWEALLRAGVDLINTDDLAGLSRFLTNR